MRTFFVVAAALLALAACKDDRRRDRDRDEPRQEQPAGGIDFRSTTGSGVKEEPNDTFHIPACGKGKLGYVTTRWPAPMAGATMLLTYTVTMSEDADIVGFEDTKESDGRMALHFQRRGDRDMAQEEYDRGFRQWSLARHVLEPGAHTFEVALTGPDKWTGGGSKSQADFDAAKREVENIGFTLSGSQSAGHGVCMAAGTAKITVTGMSVQ